MTQGFTNSFTTPIPVSQGGTGVTTSTGTGSVVLSISPSLVTPLLGTPTSGVLTNCTGYTQANIVGAAWTDWSGSIGFTGFSANPTSILARYQLIGKICFVNLGMTSGTSNANTFTITGLPVAAAAFTQYPLSNATNNGSAASNYSGFITASGTTLTLNVGSSSTGWTASGLKGITCNFFYETA